MGRLGACRRSFVPEGLPPNCAMLKVLKTKAFGLSPKAFVFPGYRFAPWRGVSWIGANATRSLVLVLSL
jgi:hypothetical protein